MTEVPARRACVWCKEPDMWPDRCAIDNGDDTCAELIEGYCEDWGDHRRCQASHCQVAATFFNDVRATGMKACAQADQPWAVVSIVADMVQLVGTSDHLGRAKSTLRTRFLKEVGCDTGPSGKGLVYVVRREDGAFL